MGVRLQQRAHELLVALGLLLGHLQAATGLAPGCPNGLVIMTGRPVELTDLQVWEMATYDQAVLEIHRGSPVDAALALAEGAGTSYAQRVNDQWNIAGIKSNDGYPTVTSHYG